MASKTFYKSSTSYGVPHHSSTRGYSSSKGKTQSTMLVVLGILLFVIIVGVIMYSSYNREGFFSASPNKLVYLYMENCSFCKEFNSTWETIETEVKSNSAKYNITMDKLDLNKEGQQLSNQNGIDYAPAIVLITPAKSYIFEGDRTKTEILKWVSSKI
jgi:hypothetical protein